MRLIPRVQEANSISKALDKGLAFKAKLVANHKRSVVDEDDLVRACLRRPAVGSAAGAH